MARDNDEDLSIRDRIALRALDGMMRDPNFGRLLQAGQDTGIIGRVCYAIADSLLAAREAKR